MPGTEYQPPQQDKWVELFEGNETKDKGLINLFLLDFPFPGKIFESGLLHIKHLAYW